MAPKRNLNILVEGGADYDFFEKVLKKRFEKKYGKANLIRYAKALHNIKNEKSDSSFDFLLNQLDEPTRIRVQSENDKGILFRLFNPKLDMDYILVADMDTYVDSHERKHSIMKHLPGLNGERIALVIICIESWYVAGQEYEHRSLSKKMMELKPEKINKEIFRCIADDIGISDRTLRCELLTHYDTNLAKERCPSFSDFWSTFVESDF